MLLVRTYVERSSIHGLGLYADQFIAEGSVIWELMPGFDFVVQEKELENRPAVIRDYVDRYGYYSESSQGFVICADDARFFNHSDFPNTISISQDLTLALRDIEKGEELTCNYYEFDATAVQHFSRESKVS
ncbi:MAG: SET domain-containing protein-lysine N-methyltransferase [Leptospiraceae bacterium]|nr:SET domain-containing protein-lysine N-methyltransferase [Leptospiraceae bacterium]